jgi:hypothetical protein
VSRDSARRGRGIRNPESADRATIRVVRTRAVRTRNARRKNATRNRALAVAVVEVVAGVAVIEVVKRAVSAEASRAVAVQVNEAANAAVGVVVSAAGVVVVVKVRGSGLTQSGRAAIAMMRLAHRKLSGRKNGLRATTRLATSGRRLVILAASVASLASHVENHGNTGRPNLKTRRQKCRSRHRSPKCASSRRSRRP